ncbi:PREDICTED: probable basic-leucine zipper transcription factor E [Populus euphratica]|uniref:Probable basic-leucine zipper transcription factor E n=1 Tax=Populus euphratica TaxID=75702 RepID=A0AAJ6X0B7_POPEU|nr:PREDICTED: probable basic-leucine zipper transcription factor E [Populus euphratica]
MEGVGARLGRSSTRYGPATVFSGPVRKWKKRWVHVTPPSSSSNHNNTHSHHHHHAISNGTAAANNSSSSNGNNGSHLLLYKWTPLSQSNGSSSPSPATNNNGNSNNDDNKNNANLSNGDAPDEPPRRKFKYIPVDLLEKQKKEAEEQEALEKVDDESKLYDTDPKAELVSKSDSAEEKPDINDIPMEENEDDNQVVRQDLNESTLDLSLGLVS